MEEASLRRLGWKPFFERQVSAETLAGGVVARVSAHLGSQVLLLGAAGEFRIPVQLAESASEVAVGDWLVLSAADSRARVRLERLSLLVRKAAGEEARPQAIAANVDTIFIVSSCNEEFRLSRLERYLALALQAGAAPVAVLTKADLCGDPATLRRQVEALHAGLVVETLDARQPEAAALAAWCGPGQTVALVGSSGVGKSTLASSLGAGELATGEIRAKDGRGRHTTTWRSLHRLPSGGVLIDNPGIRELQLPACGEGLRDVFDDVVQIAARCRYGNCNHDGDAGCAVQAAIEAGELDPRRLANYLKLDKEQAHNSRTLAQRRERDRKFGRMAKAIINSKPRNRQDR